ncbi:DUF302 domain-containing protein [Flexibacterium corallicola]|uniref:DUF302 domain-containing protein n=1 Tax=Flexibacterium corallicola TaxID=3037259 RepID=UPI00286EC3A8|nr:DUF302 domain-containing protein [Pseudovibrio sp. M1P-2-3]
MAALIVVMYLGEGAKAQNDLDRQPGWRVIKSSMQFNDLLLELRNAVAQEDMHIVTQASASMGAEKQGATIPGNYVIGVFRNDFALRVLKTSLAAGIEAPIRFYVTENLNGTGTLSWKPPSYVFSPYIRNSGGAELEAVAEELDQIFQSIADRATQTGK